MTNNITSVNLLWNNIFFRLSGCKSKEANNDALLNVYNLKRLQMRCWGLAQLYWLWMEASIRRVMRLRKFWTYLCSVNNLNCVKGHLLYITPCNITSWSALPNSWWMDHVVTSQSVNTIQRNLKTYLFSLAFSYSILFIFIVLLSTLCCNLARKALYK